jgi:hypothetical protein
MAKTTAPLLAFGARGQIGKTQVYASWRGVSYARRHVVPANPNSTSQQRTRGVFSWLNATWKLMDPAVQTAWFDFSKGKPVTDRNSWIKSNLFDLRGTDGAPVSVITSIKASPGVNGGLAMASVVWSDGGTHHLSAVVTAPTLPTGWTYIATHVIAWEQQDAHSAQLYTSYYNTGSSGSPETVLVALGAAMTAVGSAFIEYTKPDGSTAFSPSSSAATVVA